MPHNYSPFLTGGSLLCVQLFATWPYSELDEFSPYPTIVISLIHVDIILLSTSRSSKYSEDALLLSLHDNMTSKRTPRSCACNSVSY